MKRVQFVPNFIPTSPLKASFLTRLLDVYAALSSCLPNCPAVLAAGHHTACCRRVQRYRAQPQGGTGKWRVVDQVRQVGQG